MFARLGCRLFGHVWVERNHGTRLHCTVCSTERAGYQPKES